MEWYPSWMKSIIDQHRQIKQLTDPFSGLETIKGALTAAETYWDQQRLLGNSPKHIADISATAEAALQASQVRDIRSLVSSTAFHAAQALNASDVSYLLDQAQMGSAFWLAEGRYRSQLTALSETASEVLRYQQHWAALLENLEPDELEGTYEIARSMLVTAGEDVQSNAIAPEEQAAALTNWFRLVLERFVANSEAGIRGFGILELIQLVAAVLSMTAVFSGPEFGPEDRDRAQATSDAVKSLKNLTDAAAKANVERTALLASMPRAIVSSKWANVRVEPRANSDGLARLQKGTHVGIVGKRGRWSEVVFLDPVSGEAAPGWVWTGSIEHLN